MRRRIANNIILLTAVLLLSKGIGFARSIIQAMYYGAGQEMDIFNVAYGIIQDIVYMITSSVAIILVPEFIKAKNRGCEKSFLTSVSTVLAIIACTISGCLIIAAGPIVGFLIPSYSGEILSDTVKMIRIIALSIVFAVLVPIFQSALNAERKYIYAMVPAYINNAILILTMFYDKGKSIKALAFAVVISYIAQFVIIGLIRIKDIISMEGISIWNENIKRFALLSIPVLFIYATIEINQAVDRLLYTKQATGAVSAVSYAAVIYQFASILCVTSITTVITTELSEAAVDGEITRMKTLAKKGIRMIFIISLPLMILFEGDSIGIIKIVFGRGSFDENAVALTATALAAYMLCLIPDGIKMVFIRAFFSMNDTRSPLIAAIIEMITNIVLSIALAREFGVYGILLATALACFISNLVLVILFKRKHFILIEWRGITSAIKPLLSAVVSMILLIVIKSKTTASNAISRILIEAGVSLFIYIMIWSPKVLAMTSITSNY